MKSRLLLPLVAVLIAGIAGTTAQTPARAPEGQETVAKTSQQGGVPTPVASHARPDAGRQSSAPIIEADAAYKANCTRCHLAPRKFSPRKTATIMRHMRVRANLTKDETDAILRYLTQ